MNIPNLRLWLILFLTLPWLRAEVLLRTDFSANKVSGATAEGLMWTGKGLGGPDTVTVENIEPGTVEGLFTSQSAQGKFAVSKNLVTEGPWRITLPLTVSADEVRVEAVELDWQHFNQSGALQQGARVAEWTATLVGSTSGIVASVARLTPRASSGKVVLPFNKSVRLDSTEAWTLRLGVDKGEETQGNNTGLTALVVRGSISGGEQVDPATVDQDRDGLVDVEEINRYGTDPLKRDTDGDGTPDGLEVEAGLDPKDAGKSMKRPNIVFFFVDDLGYGDLGSFWQDQRTEGPKFDTPHLDSMAAAGAKLTHHYISAPVCAPSRASLMQGRHQGHADIRDSGFDRPLPDNHTISDLLQRAGYHTIHIGKAGISGSKKTVDLKEEGTQNLEGHPLKRGFDEFFGYLFHGDGHEHFPNNGKTNKKAHIYHNYRQVTDASQDLYTTDAWTAYAKQAILREVEDGDEQPFFLYLAYDTPHFKMQRPAAPYPHGGGVKGGIQWTEEADASGMVRYASTADGTGKVDGYSHPDIDPAWPTSAQQHVGMIRRIDHSIGDLLQLLEELDLEEDTLVVFSSDNGPHNEGNNPRTFESYANMEGIKRDMIEAGIRVPTIVKWPGKIPQATGDENRIHEIDYPSAIWDWMPTFAEVAGVPAPAWCDGVSLVPTLTENGDQRDKGYLYFEFLGKKGTPRWAEFPNQKGRAQQQMQCVRIGDHMGIRRKISGAEDDFEIYDVVRDPAQSTDVAASLPELQAEMKRIGVGGRRPHGRYPRPYDQALVPAVEREVVPGLDVSVYGGIWSYVPEFRDMIPKATGQVQNLDLTTRPPETDVGFLFTGYIRIPTDGQYIFAMKSDGGAHLFVQDAHVIDDDFQHDGAAHAGRMYLKAGLHPIRLYYRHGHAAEYLLELTWAGPGIEKQVIPDSAYFR